MPRTAPFTTTCSTPTSSSACSTAPAFSSWTFEPALPFHIVAVGVADDEPPPGNDAFLSAKRRRRRTASSVATAPASTEPEGVEHARVRRGEPLGRRAGREPVDDLPRVARARPGRARKWPFVEKAREL